MTLLLCGILSANFVPGIFFSTVTVHISQKKNYIQRVRNKLWLSGKTQGKGSLALLHGQHLPKTVAFYHNRIKLSTLHHRNKKNSGSITSSAITTHNLVSAQDFQKIKPVIILACDRWVSGSSNYNSGVLKNWWLLRKWELVIFLKGKTFGRWYMLHLISTHSIRCRGACGHHRLYLVVWKNREHKIELLEDGTERIWGRRIGWIEWKTLYEFFDMLSVFSWFYLFYGFHVRMFSI